MHRDRIVVLKFGSSVLECEADLSGVVHEIYRWIREGHRVVAVVSAMGTTTNELLRQSQRYGLEPREEAVAALVATGEATSAALLGLALDRAGISASILDAAAIALRTRGPLLDAEPCELDPQVILRALEKSSVAVVPGFLGRHENGQTSLLGRGGSDLTALFLAHRLRAARCRLIKDVNGLYDCDPALNQLAARYKTVSWDDAYEVGGEILQPKAIQFAKAHRLRFEVGCLASADPTLVAAETRFCEEAKDITNRAAVPLRVGLLGLGTVGYGVYLHLSARPDLYEIVKIAVRRIPRLHEHAPISLLTTNPREVVNEEVDVIIELIGGESPAYELVAAALASGKHVVTANKLLISKRGLELQRIAEENNVTLSYSAAVGGGVPMLEIVRQLATTRGIASLEGVVNATTNFVLDRITQGENLEAAVRAAQQLGFAEQDPTLDLSGADAAQKLALLAQAGWGNHLNPAEIDYRGIQEIDPQVVLAEAKKGGSMRLVASLETTATGVRVRVAPEVLAADDPLAQVRAEQNALSIVTEDGQELFLIGKGAGRWPTSEAVLADVHQLCCVSQRVSAEAEYAAVGRTS